MDALPDGHEIGGYRIVRVAGRGAVGVVYEARHVTLGKRVAIKTLNRTFAGESEFRARFDREAQGAASVDHPNITAVFDAGEQGGVPYLVMTYVDGPDLERILASRGGPLEPAEAILICRAVADALDAAAALGLAHRDVKPANILLEDWDVEPGSGQRVRPHVYLTDFGLTKHNAAATVTRTGQFVGTLLYMAPEQIEGRAVAASDQYSLACVLWECLVGSPPFVPSGGSNLSLLTAHLSDPVPPLSARSRGRFPVALDSVFAKAMHKKAAKRYGSCVEFVDAAAVAMGLGRPGADQALPPTAPATPVAEPRTAVISAEMMDELRAGVSDKSKGESQVPRQPWPTSGSRSPGQPPSGPSATPRPPERLPASPVTGPPVTGAPGRQSPVTGSPSERPAAAAGRPIQSVTPPGGPPGAPPISGTPLNAPTGGPPSYGSSGPSGLPAGLSPQAYSTKEDGSKAWLWIVLAVIVIGAIIAAVVITAGG